VLTGAAAGKLGVIASQQASIATHYKIKFEPPVYLPAVGHVASVERAVTDLVSI
jgi:hypothetical protein